MYKKRLAGKTDEYLEYLDAQERWMNNNGSRTTFRHFISTLGKSRQEGVEMINVVSDYVLVNSINSYRIFSNLTIFSPRVLFFRE